MAADTYDLALDQGADWFWNIRWRVGATQRSAVSKNTTGYTARMQVRKTYSSPTTMLNLTTQNGGITVSNDGLIQLRATAIQTAAMQPGKAVYDVEVISNNSIVTKIVRGTIRVVAEVTR